MVLSVVVVLAIAKRKSFVRYRSIEELKAGLKSPCRIHGTIQSVKSDSGVLTMYGKGRGVRCSNQIPFPRYLFKPSWSDAIGIPLSLLAVNQSRISTVGEVGVCEE